MIFSSSPMNLWTYEPMNLWNLWTLLIKQRVFWWFFPVVLWTYEPMNLWTYEPMNLWNLWTYEPMNLWSYEPVKWCEALSFGGRLKRFQGSPGNIYAGVFLEDIIRFFASKKWIFCFNDRHSNFGFLARIQVLKSIRDLVRHRKSPTMPIMVDFCHFAWVFWFSGFLVFYAPVIGISVSLSASHPHLCRA